MRAPLAVLALASVSMGQVQFTMLGEGGCHGTPLGGIIAHTPSSALKECASKPSCGGYWFATIHPGDSETGEAQFFGDVYAATSRGMGDYATAKCWKQDPTPSPTSTPTALPTASPTFRGPSCRANMEGHPNEEMGIGTVYQPTGPDYCNWCKCVCRVMLPHQHWVMAGGAFDPGKASQDPANCLDAEIRCTKKPCDKWKVVKTSAKKCDHVKCGYHKKALVQVKHHHLEHHLNHKCNFNRLTYEDLGEEEACTCLCWDKIINYSGDGKGGGHRVLGWEYKRCSKVISDKAIHWAKSDASEGSWGPYLAPTPWDQKPMTQEDCIKACEENEKCAGWSYRYGEPEHKHFQKCWLLDDKHVSYAPKDAKGKFDSGVCEWVDSDEEKMKRNATDTEPVV